MTDEKRIQKDASKYASIGIIRNHDLQYAETDYIAGATSEREKLKQDITTLKALLPIAQHCVQLFEWEGKRGTPLYEQYKSAIERAKKVAP